MAISPLIHRLHTCLTETVDMTQNGANFLYKFGFTINYNDNLLQWMDHKIPLTNLDEFFNNNMFLDLNNELCLNKEDNMFDQENLNN